MPQTLWTLLLTLSIFFIDLHSASNLKIAKKEFAKYIKWNDYENWPITADLFRFTTNRITICNKDIPFRKKVKALQILISDSNKACALLKTMDVYKCKSSESSLDPFEEFSQLYKDKKISPDFGNKYKENWKQINLEFCEQIAPKKSDWKLDLLIKYAMVLRDNFYLHLYTSQVHKFKKEHNRLLQIICKPFDNPDNFNNFVTTLCTNLCVKHTALGFSYLKEYLKKITHESVCVTSVKLEVNEHNCHINDSFRVAEGDTVSVQSSLDFLLYKYAPSGLPSYSKSKSKDDEENDERMTQGYLWNELNDNYQAEVARLRGDESVDKKRFKEDLLLPVEIAPQYDLLRRFVLLLLYLAEQTDSEKLLGDLKIEEIYKKKEEEKEEKKEDTETVSAFTDVPLQEPELGSPGEKSSSKKGVCFRKLSKKTWIFGLVGIAAAAALSVGAFAAWKENNLPFDTMKSGNSSGGGGIGGSVVSNLQWIYLAGGLLLFIVLIALFCYWRKVRRNGQKDSQTTSSTAKEDDRPTVQKVGKYFKRAVPKNTTTTAATTTSSTTLTTLKAKATMPKRKFDAKQSPPLSAAKQSFVKKGAAVPSALKTSAAAASRNTTTTTSPVSENTSMAYTRRSSGIGLPPPKAPKTPKASAAVKRKVESVSPAKIKEAPKQKISPRSSLF